VGLSEMNKSGTRQILREVLKGLEAEVLWDAPVAPYTALKVGGPADALVFPESASELALILQKASAHRIPCFVLGRGSNLLVKDGGLAGLVLHLKRLDKITLLPDARLLAEAGASYPRVSQLAAEKGWGGLEFAVGIPGTVGGAVAMNAGIPGAETASVLEEIMLLSEEGLLRACKPADLAFGYRRSGLQGEVVIAACFRLQSAPKAQIDAKRRALLRRRQVTQPLEFSNCGSVFQNPPGNFAGRLIERCGLKGYRQGDAAISERHANFLLNLGAARAQDLIALIEKMKEAVRMRFGIELKLEVTIVGRP